MVKWIKSKSPGVRFRKHSTRKHGVKFDQYYSIRYRVDGKQREEGLGWASEGWSDSKAAATLAELKSNKTTGQGPTTLGEKRQIEQDRKNAEIAELKAQEAREYRLDLTKLNNVFGEYCRANSHKKSLKDEKNYYKNWIKKSLGDKRLEEIQLLDLERIKSKMTKAGNAPRSIQYIKSIIRQVYNYAIDVNLHDGALPTTRFLKKQNKVDNKRQRYLSTSEADLLLTRIKEKSKQCHDISLVALNCGLRFGEIAGLKWQHVNVEERSLLIIDPKNGESRYAYMTDAVDSMFNGLEKGKPDSFVFSSNKGTRMGRISKTFAETVKILGFNDGINDRRLKVVFHTLRHSCASWLKNSGVDLDVIGKILGHKTLTMTQRYSHINDNRLLEAMKLIDQKQIEKGKVRSISNS